MVMNINNCWKLFCYGVKRDHYENLINIREFMEKLAQDCFKNYFSNDNGTTAKNIPHLMRLMIERPFLLAAQLIL